ncbi:hypothetical protein LSAT2_011764 [Lamellibrachia satsuma]|nr:hypothetical protein LSAT2_011764 [Lamellibrachia satsuma]
MHPFLLGMKVFPPNSTTTQKSRQMPDDRKEQHTTEMFTDFETLAAKFNFIDLACSERLKCTGATVVAAARARSISRTLCQAPLESSVRSSNFTRPSGRYHDSRVPRAPRDFSSETYQFRRVCLPNESSPPQL